MIFSLFERASQHRQAILPLLSAIYGLQSLISAPLQQTIQSNRLFKWNPPSHELTHPRIRTQSPTVSPPINGSEIASLFGARVTFRLESSLWRGMFQFKLASRTSDPLRPTTPVRHQFFCRRRGGKQARIVVGAFQCSACLPPHQSLASCYRSTYNTFYGHHRLAKARFDGTTCTPSQLRRSSFAKLPLLLLPHPRSLDSPRFRSSSAL